MEDTVTIENDAAAIAGDDELFIEWLLSNITGNSGSTSPDYTLLYKPWITERLRGIEETNHELFRGRFEPTIRGIRTLFWPDVYRVISEDTKRAADVDARRFPFATEDAITPPLPSKARLDDYYLRTWLDDYAAHSAYWAPRAAPSYHKAVGLWVLSAIAARRVVVHMGSTPVYPTLFIALVSESTHWTKTTAAAIGIKILRQSGCGHLLAPDRTTPQFLLKLMSGVIPQDYGMKTPEEKAFIRECYGFSAQRGWFYEEWGGMLHQMRRTDSPQAELNKLLIVLEGGQESFETGTIQRGLERVRSPYLALLGNATPHDLAQFMQEGNAWWHDGFWPRFACATPPANTKPSRAQRPRETYHIPPSILTQIHEWNIRLGKPEVSIELEREPNGKITGNWIGSCGPLPVETLTLNSEAYDAYEQYNDALLEIAHEGKVHTDLSPWYGRAHEKALRVSMLLASLHGEKEISLGYWSIGQEIVEEWRNNLHELILTASASTPLSKDAQIEGKIVSLCAKSGGMTARELQRHIKGVSSENIHRVIVGMLKTEAISQVKNGKKVIYSVLDDDHEVSTNDSEGG